MKVNKIKNIVVFAILLSALLSLVVIKFFVKQNSDSSCELFELDEVLLEINLATNNSFSIADLDVIIQYFPIDFNEESEYLFANNIELSKEYFVIVKNLSLEKLEELKKYVKFNTNEIVLGTHNEYTYIIFSETYNSTIEGIIRSYIYCD